MTTALDRIAHVNPESLDITLPGVYVLAIHVRSMLVELADMRARYVAVDNARERLIIDADIARHVARIEATWHACHLVAGAEQQAQRSIDGILRSYVVDADREARLARPLPGEAVSLEAQAHARSAERLRTLVGNLATRGYATEAGALP